MDYVEFMEVLEALKDLMNVKFDEWFWDDGSFAEHSEWSSFKVLQYQVNLVIFDDSVLILDDVLVIEIFQDCDLFLDGADVLLADVYFLHGNKNSIVEVDSFVNFPIGSLPNLLDQLIALDDFALRKIIHWKQSGLSSMIKHKQNSGGWFCSFQEAFRLLFGRNPSEL